ncbi:MAG: winged helix-turn-helix domain-containing protein [Candidatus Eremiobacteraeota bacterium]|nr:winged helix-turn-helix domain-containing protein [Candidatus Eremiobacteraeota bacterium]
MDGRVVALQSKAADALSILVDAGGEIVSKEALRELLWPPDAVDEGSLYQTIYLLRRALSAAKPGCVMPIETVGRAGYRLVPRVEPETITEPPRARIALYPVVAAALLALVVLAASAPRFIPGESPEAKLSPAARRSHAIGHTLLAQRTVESISKSIGYFKAVVEADPQSAVGYADLGGAYTILLGYRGIDEKKGFPIAERYARQALARDPTYPPALTTLGFILFERDGADEAAAQMLRRAVERDPRFGPAWESLGIVDLARDRLQKAQNEFGRAVELNPGMAPYLMWQGIAQYYAANFSAAAATLRASTDIAAQPIALYYLLLTYEVEGDVKAEKETLGRLQRTATQKAKLDAVGAFVDFKAARSEVQRARSLSEIRRIAKRDADARFLLAVSYGLLRRDREALALLRRRDARDVAFIDYRFLPIDPHFKRLMR